MYGDFAILCIQYTLVIARKLFPDCENDTLMPLKITVSLPVENGSQNVKGSESFYVRQSSTSMLTAADVAQKTTGQSSPLDVMMSATLGSSSSEQELRLVVIFLPLFAMNTVKPVFFACHLFREFRDPDEFAKITGRGYIF